ncbi:hypothetical protein LAZ67_1004126, partial [Cordylochernes scorpioides]
MMSDAIRRVDQYSPKSSPRGARSPVVPRQDSSGTLKTTISLGKTPAIVHIGPFYLMKEAPMNDTVDVCVSGERTNRSHQPDGPPQPGALVLQVLWPQDEGPAVCLPAQPARQHRHPQQPGQQSVFTTEGMLSHIADHVSSSLRSLIEKPPIGGKDIVPLTSTQLAGFRLHPGPFRSLPNSNQIILTVIYPIIHPTAMWSVVMSPVGVSQQIPEQMRPTSTQIPQKKKHKHKKHKHKPGDTPSQDSQQDGGASEGNHEKKHKKGKRHDDDKERKKKKKEKKKKKFEAVPYMEVDAFAADSNMSTDTAPTYPWSGTFAEVHQPASKQLRILQCNINGLCSTATKIKLEEIMEIAEKQKIQIIALQETKLNEKYNLKYKNYNILRKDRNKEGGGLAFLIKNLYYEDIAINIPNTSDLEAQGIKVYLSQNKTINIFNMYHPPNNKLIDDGTMAQFLTDNTIIVGDLNAKHQLWGCSMPNPRGKILSNIFDDNAFMCLNDGNPTHHSYSYNTAQALDISFSSPDIFHKCKWQILKSIGSDHLPILIEISTKTKTSSIKEKFWNFKKANWNLYQKNTNEDFRKAPTRIKDLEQNWISFKNTIIKAAKVSIPRGNIKKWIPNYTHQAKDIQTLITKRNELQKKCTQNQTNCRTELNIVNAKIKRLYVNMKREKWKQTCENLNPRNPNTKLWHLAKQIDRAQPQTENTNMIKNTDGTPATNDKNAANLLGNSYQISSKIKFEIKDKKVEKKARKIIHDCKNFTSTHNIFHEKINMKELDYALENTDLNKTPGPDGIHGQMISNLGKNGKEILLDIFNNSWKTGKLPQDWKTATIIPIKKLDKSADDPKNYRPISLTSICCKLMEKIILRRLTYHLDTRNLLPEEQYGFRKGHGTIDQLLFFTQKVKDAQNRKPTSHTIAAFLDLTQAFDKVWKNKLITKLYKHFKIDGKAITWINDFLKNRYIRVKYNGTLSKTFKLYQGLPQGSVLSPTLFTLFIAGIEEKISHKTNIGLFADDIILWSSNTNWKKAERDLNKTLLHLEKFANKHKLEFNPQKSETCLFTTDKKLYKIRPKIILKEQQLQYNKHPKYLGYTLDPEINSSKHIEEVIRKGRDRLKILKYISGREWGADATTLKLTYTSLIRPILEYGYQIYGTASETNLKSLERIQLSAARIITGLRNTCPNDIVLYEADIMPLKDRRSYNLPKYINKIKSYGNKHRTSNYILNWESNLRLKKEGPLHLAKRNGFLKYKVEKNYLAEKISPCEPLQNVIFNDTLNEPTNKQYQNPEYLKQLSLEIINNIPKNAITIYTDGSRDELGHTGSGCLIKTTNGIEKMNRRNPDFCSVFRSELIAIYEALKSIRNTNYQDIWILTDSRSAIQHLSHTGELRDKVSRNIIGYLQKLSKTSKIHLQWIPSHVGIEGNEAADVLAKKGTKEPLPQKNKLTFKEIETVAKTKINKNWRIPPKHSWYSGVNPGGALNIRNRQHQTTLTRFRTGHLKPLKIENNNKIYPTCPKCSLSPAAPEHILACIRCTKQDLWERPLLIIKQLEEHELMEFVRDKLGHTGSGCLIKTTNGIEKMNRRNPDFCSVFRSELIAIYEALKSIRNTNFQDIWILTDSRSAIQHLSHTGQLRDKVNRNIIGYLQKLSKTSKIHLQWMPLHVGIEGNEAADVLAKKGTKEPLPQKNKLTFKEIKTIAKTKINKNWRIPPKHSWYSGVNPGGALNIRNRQHQTTLTRFRTGHLKPLKIENNNKIYPTCPKCSLSPAAPEHILACIRCTKQDLWERPLLIIKQLEEHELMEF